MEITSQSIRTALLTMSVDDILTPLEKGATIVLTGKKKKIMSTGPITLIRSVDRMSLNSVVDVYACATGEVRKAHIVSTDGNIVIVFDTAKHVPRTGFSVRVVDVKEGESINILLSVGMS